ncbi:uncharacterized protein L3040_006290 [Drepanopeziza brunnea f. sp. 'multigermtubi']|uniref:DNA mismatch repair protein HSM3 N-terminal domain-containing protein n=1 Tax=Marssonina brunnea f. sp. multigermtubi (strain MB_m1) TaxID=1072389 RepID=K1XVR3_MARBU|nr:uncharacterized protein MBM_05258 [Drepanopeziza brunnea f. sp. 'multigermtubi' MB_m1]EKD16789.1 hypothetical protein MBM_05258 [Drepanopeziza brunnea f. sp. 'multigermtubi' MB_m1]KAJ5040641.1 hypothetical protein L3040_006290 [Drepanopeziza brunnea f. sp. 'multigermtubi']
MNHVPVAGLEELERHLRHVVDVPETPLDAKLFDEVELQLTDTNIPPLIPRLLPNLTRILLTYEQDPTILASLSIKLIRPIQFTQVLTLASEDALIQALRSPAPSANLLAIIILEKATRSPGDTAILSIMRGVVESFLRTWLSTPDVGVGEKATMVLGDLLEVDCDRRSSASITTKMGGLQLAAGMAPGQGLLWRRVFQDREIYDAIFSLCSSTTIGTGEGQLDERQKSLAQARLLRILPRLATLDFQTITHTKFPDIEKKYNVGQPGILYFATVDMVNKEQDMLMHITLLDLFAEFLEMMSITELTKPTMDYLAALVKKVATSDPVMYKHLEAIAMSPETAENSPELADLLLKLNGYP